MALFAVLVSLIVSVLAGTVGTFAAGFIGIKGGYLPLEFGGMVAVAAFVPTMIRQWGKSKLRIDVTPETTTVAWKETASSPTKSIRDVEAFQKTEDANGDPSFEWTVRYKAGADVVTLPLWGRSEQLAKMRAERLRTVITLFQSREKPG
jgi:hypothetical protein